MVVDAYSEPPRDAVDRPLQPRIIERDEAAAPVAHQVVVVLPARQHALEPGLIPIHGDSLHQPVLGELIVQQLAAAGISAVSQLSSGNPEFGASGGRTIYVEEQDLERARAALADTVSDISDEELAELSEAAAREARAGED